MRSLGDGWVGLMRCIHRHVVMLDIFSKAQVPLISCMEVRSEALSSENPRSLTLTCSALAEDAQPPLLHPPVVDARPSLCF